MSDPAGPGASHPSPANGTDEDATAAVLGKADALLGRYRRPPAAPDEDFPLLTEVLDTPVPETAPRAVNAPPGPSASPPGEPTFAPSDPHADDTPPDMRDLAEAQDGTASRSGIDPVTGAVRAEPPGPAHSGDDGAPRRGADRPAREDEPFAPAAQATIVHGAAGMPAWDAAQHEEIVAGVARHLAAALTEALTRVAQERAEALAAELRLEAQALARRAVADAVARALAEADLPPAPADPAARDRPG